MTMPERGRQAVGRRGEVLQLLRDTNGPLDIAEIAGRLGIHVNTARFHLETLVNQGQVERTTAERGALGRPPLLFQAAPGMDPMGPRHYQVLAEVLAAGFAADPEPDPDPSRRAAEAGRIWGRRQATAVAGTPESIDPTDPVGRLRGLLDEMGFAPEPAADGDPPQIRLRHCPFLELAVSRPEVVCPAHLGLMQGAMESWDSPVTVHRLEAFAEPGLCLAHLAAAEAS